MSETSTATRWLLSRIEDYSGNAINFDFVKEPNYAYLSTVSYANRVVKFTYDSSRTDVQRRFYRNLLDYQVAQLLKTISITASNGANNLVELKRMELAFSQSGVANISLLKSLQMCISSNNSNSKSCLRPLVFEYDQTRVDQFGSTFVLGDLCGGATDGCETNLLQAADMNGDGLADLVAFGADGVYVTLNQGSFDDSISFGPAQKWTTDFSKTTGWDSTKHLRYVADLNADGLPDLFGIADNGVYVSLNANGYFKSIQKWSDNFGYNQGYRLTENSRWLTDIDNDGRPDLVVINAGSTGGIRIAFNLNATKLTDAKDTIVGEFDPSVPRHPVTLIDLDGDGIKERTGFGPDGIWIGKLYSNVKMANLINPLSISYYNYIWDGSTTRLFVDMNGDNLADIVGFRDSKVYTAFLTPKDTGYNWFNCSSVLPGPFASVGSSTSNKVQIPIDINGDGLVDLVAFDSMGVFVGLNDGSGTVLQPSLWTTNIKSPGTFDMRFLVDMNGDQLPDLLGFEASALGGNIAKIQLNQNHKTKLTGIVDSFGTRKSISYSTVPIEAKRKNLVRYILISLINFYFL